jgi:lysozyme family protein
MASINQIVDFILWHEDPTLSGKVTTDAGGVTRWGIASKFHPGLDVANLSLSDARSIYLNEYILPAQLDQVRDQDVANACGDCLVNPGPGAGPRVIQQAINLYRAGTVAEDGKIGPDTISHLNGCAENDILPRLRVARVLYYLKDVQANPSKAGNLMGWLVRACG